MVGGSDESIVEMVFLVFFFSDHISKIAVRGVVVMIMVINERTNIMLGADCEREVPCRKCGRGIL